MKNFRGKNLGLSRACQLRNFYFKINSIVFYFPLLFQQEEDYVQQLLVDSLGQFAPPLLLSPRPTGALKPFLLSPGQ